ncbi:unnamed protein product [Paramecium sonneborni]|uniref:UBA domain-containing protein n=1 Tax=Paramecium sonneborni TaxID=65129 RepID=A0A8S1PS83_9CILI|nr:unnamed protein product [Paramecium sonneborni]
MINQHPLYLEQQQWLAQFQKGKQNPIIIQEEQQDLINELFTMGFDDEKRILKLIKKHKGDKAKIVESLIQKKNKKKKTNDIDIIQIVKDTQILYVDCNNVKYANRNWNEFHGKQKEQIVKMLIIIVNWLENANSQLNEVHLIWDVYKIQNIEKLQNELSQLNQFKNLQNLSQEGKKISFQIQYNQKKILFTIQSSHPGIADDLIVNLCSQRVQKSGETTVVTSDRGLRDRLKEFGVQHFIGCGEWWRLQLNGNQLQIE